MTKPTSDIFHKLENVIRDRRNHPVDNSYVCQLINDAPMSLTAKLIEEAYEVVHALGDEETNKAESITHEAADLLFHLLVILGWSDVAWSDVEQQLEERFGTGGLEELSQRHV